MKLKIALKHGAFMPTRAHEYDAGLDLMSPLDFYVPVKGDVVIDTGVHVEIPEGYVGILKSKSGLNVRHGLISDGVIDSGYSGSIVVKLYNLDGYSPYTIHRGDKITQLLILPIELPELELVNKITGGERGNNGFGSTGR